MTYFLRLCIRGYLEKLQYQPPSVAFLRQVHRGMGRTGRRQAAILKIGEFLSQEREYLFFIYFLRQRSVKENLFDGGVMAKEVDEIVGFYRFLGDIGVQAAAAPATVKNVPERDVVGQ